MLIKNSPQNKNPLKDAVLHVCATLLHVGSVKKQEAHGPHRSPELTAVNMYM